MKLEDIKEQFPLHTTLAGYYDTDQSFKAHSFNEVKNIDVWDNAPLDWGEGALPFIRYNREKDEFECWYFCYHPVVGYLYNGELSCAYYDYQDEAWHTFNHADTVLTIKDPWLQDNYSEQERPLYENRVEQAAHFFDSKAYEEGRILTSYDAVKRFCSDERNFK